MTFQELETQCMAMSNTVDTEIVEGDPLELSTFDATTLYVWLVPDRPGGQEAPDDARHGAPNMIVRGRYGAQNEVAESVPEVAKRLGVNAR